MPRCRCHSRKLYKRCCKPWHDGHPAPSPEALMRSRYSAYALGLVEYILATTHPAGPQHRADTEAWRAEVAAFAASGFPGLQLHASETDGDVGWVTFTAQVGRGAFTERSRFERLDGRWLYHSGEAVSPPGPPRPSPRT